MYVQTTRFAGALLLFALAQQTNFGALGHEDPEAQVLDPPIVLLHHGIPLTVVSAQAPAGSNIGLRSTASFADASPGAPDPIAIHATARAELSNGTAPNATGMKLDVLSKSLFGVMPGGEATATGLEIAVDVENALSGTCSSGTGIVLDVNVDGENVFSAVGMDITVGTLSDDSACTGIQASVVGGRGESSSTVGGDFTSISTGCPFADAIGVNAFASASGMFGSCVGVQGACAQNAGFGVFSMGPLGSSSTQSILQPHPFDPARVVQFVSLEGNESGTYFRGSGRIVDGVAEIAIPEEWALVSEEQGITVQLTPVGSFAGLYVAERSRERIVVRGDRDCTFDYFVNGVRRGFAEHAPYRDNHAFRPAVRGVPFGTQYPDDLRRILVQNGTLNADFTPNEQVAARLGWELMDPDEVAPERRWWSTDEEFQQLAESRRAHRRDAPSAPAPHRR